MFERFTGQARRVLWLAYQEAQRFDHDFLGAEHLFVAALRDASPDLLALLDRHGVAPDIVLPLFEPVLLAAEPNMMEGRVYLTPLVRRVLANAIDVAQRQQSPQAGVGHLVWAVLGEPETEIHRILGELGVDSQALRADLERLPPPGNRDLSVQPRRGDADSSRVDPSPQQIEQLLSAPTPSAELKSMSFVAPEANLGGAEIDWQLLLTQLILALTVGMAGGYMLFSNVDGMAGVTSVLFVVAIFRNSLIGAVACGVLGWLLATHLDPGDGLTHVLLPLAGGFVGSFLGNFWRRYCPFVIKPGQPPPRPPVP
jgi:Clp amino terminal domain, pathogenicity island component